MLSGQWLLDSHISKNKLLSFVQATIALEIILGEEKKVEVFQFLKEPLIRKYGAEWFTELEIASKNLDNLEIEE